MTKEELLRELSEKIISGEVRREEVVAQLGIVPEVRASAGVQEEKKNPQFSSTKLLYIAGAVIAIAGIVIFIAQIWEDLGFFGHILVTLGFGLLSAVLGSMLMAHKPEDSIGAIFHVIGGALVPVGAVVTLNEFDAGDTSAWPYVFIFGSICLMYVMVNAFHKHVVLTFFSIANGTATLYLLSEALLGDLHIRNWDPEQYLTMLIGAGYLLMAHSFREGWNKKLFGPLCFFGSAGFLGAAFLQVFDSGIWELLYFFAVIGTMAISVYLKSRSVLVVSTLFLIAYVSYITSEYFADSIGWPLSLVILGFVFIGLGYASVSINKKYIKGEVDAPAVMP